MNRNRDFGIGMIAGAVIMAGMAILGTYDKKPVKAVLNLYPSWLFSRLLLLKCPRSGPYT